MNLVIALAVAALTAASVFLMLRRDVVKMIAGTLLFSNSAVLLLMSGTLSTRLAPIEPVEPGPAVADPLLAALALTAVVITFAVTVLLLSIALAVERSHDTIDMDALVRAELDEESAEDADARRGRGEPR